MFENILKYQNLDLKLLKIEKQLNDSVAKKTISEMVSLVKELQSRSIELELSSKNQLQNYESLNNLYNDQFESVSKLSKISIDSLNEEEVDKHVEKLSTASQSLQSLVHNIASANDLMQQTILEFEQTKKKVIIARTKHKQAKDLYEKQVAALNPEIESIKNEIKSIKVEESVLKKYNQLKNDKVMPVYVSVRDDCCGACMTKIPTALRSKLKDNKMLECEHCHRIIIE